MISIITFHFLFAFILKIAFLLFKEYQRLLEIIFFIVFIEKKNRIF